MPTARRKPSLVIGLNAVIVAVTDGQPRVLAVRDNIQTVVASKYRPRHAPDAIPFGPLDPRGHRTLELGLRGWVHEQTGLELGYAEQLYTFGDRHRDPSEGEGGPRVISVAYLALVREDRLNIAQGAVWRNGYAFLPWEDWRQGRPALMNSALAPALGAWVSQAGSARARRQRRERVDITFGLGGAAHDPERVLERYELLYEAGLVFEARRDRRGSRLGTAGPRGEFGRPMALDHRRLLATALGRLRGKLKYRPLVFEVLPSHFTLLDLQKVIEALAGVCLHKQNFRRLVEKAGLVEPTGLTDIHTGGRPAALFRFRREVLRERRAPGVGLPGLPREQEKSTDY